MRYIDYVVKAQVFTKDWKVKTVEKSFKTEKARAAWLDKQEAAGNLKQVLAYSDPQ